MDTIVERRDITDTFYQEMLETEKHHDHEIMRGIDYKLYWKPVLSTEYILRKLSLTDVLTLLRSLGYDKNSEVYRQLYRNMGYSLFGYWEIFYCKTNNEMADKYKPNADCIGKKINII